MDYQIKISSTAVSRAGIGYYENENNFYLNGRYAYDYEMDNIQVSLENNLDDHLFAVTGGMDRTGSDKKTAISMAKELKKFQDQVKGQGGDLEGKLLQLKERFVEINNIIYSMSLNQINEGVPVRERDTAYAGLFITDQRAAAIHLGKSKVYLQRNDSLRLLTGDAKKTEKFLKMGMLSHESSSRFGITAEDIRTELQKSETVELQPGDVFLLCSESMQGLVQDEKINEILAQNRDTGYLANMLLREALNNGCKDNITLVVVRVDQINGREKPKPRVEPPQEKRVTRQVRTERKESSVKTIVAAAAVILVAAAVLLTAYLKIGSNNKGEDGPPLVAAGSTMAEPPEDTMNLDTSAVEPVKEEPSSEAAKTAPGTPAQSTTLPTEYKVQAGDSLQKIAKRFYGDVNQYVKIMEKNKITDPNAIQIGQTLIIP